MLGLILQPHQQRVVDEFNELDTKLNALWKFMETPLFDSLSKSERRLLFRQSDYMYGYLNTLEVRINNFTKETHDH